MYNFLDKNVLFTGGNGRLGKACRIVFPDAQYPRRSQLDVRDGTSIERYLTEHEVDTVVHLAAIAGIPQCENDNILAYDVNVRGTQRMADTASRHGVKHFVFLSTACVFPGTNDLSTMPDEDTTPYPKHFYGITKLAAEEVVRSHLTAGMLTTIVRTNFTTMPWEYPRAFTDRFGTYLFAQGVAKGIKDILLERPRHPVIHVCGERPLSMFEYAKLGGSTVEPMTLNDYVGPPLTVNMCMTTKHWRKYRIEDSKPNDE